MKNHKAAIPAVITLLIAFAAVGLVLSLSGHHHKTAPATTTRPAITVPAACTPAVDPDNDCATEPDNDA